MNAAGTGGSGLWKAPPHGKACGLKASGFPTGLGKPLRGFPHLPQPLLLHIDGPLPAAQERRLYEGGLTMRAMGTDLMV